jgi:hypothetical protein
MLDELEEFFINYNRSEDRVFKPLGVEGPSTAMKLIKAQRRKS